MKNYDLSKESLSWIAHRNFNFIQILKKNSWI